MPPRNDEPLAPCGACGQHYAVADAKCPHCGTPAEEGDLPRKRRRGFLIATLAAGAGLGVVGAMRWMQVEYGPPPFRDRMQPAYGPPPMRYDPAYGAAYEAHKKGDFETAVRKYEEALRLGAPREPTERWLGEAKAKHPPTPTPGSGNRPK